ncbi:MAG: hypothetical protein FD145_1568 [Candidatus Saganbacteria bacterium]|uniref:Uncharacterized protein n=1 Tax=Candidatus Saganbacteria bacterium TaxID=2575572 RepID=A0A833KZN3_UNCSA|nr:MAG: hypothetical protein FD145_1568 [Candidatus Saganbacteria bacterium]
MIKQIKIQLLLLVLLLLVIMVFGILLYKSFVEWKQIRDFSWSISSDIENIIKNKKNLPQIKEEGIKFFEKEYLFTDKATIFLIITEYDTQHYKYTDYLEYFEHERNLKKEKEQFDRLAIGKHYGEVYFNGYFNRTFYVKNIKHKKFKYFDAEGMYVFDRIYQTFTNNYLVELFYVVNALAYGTDVIQKEGKTPSGYATKITVFSEQGTKKANVLEEIIKNIKWENN